MIDKSVEELSDKVNAWMWGIQTKGLQVTLGKTKYLVSCYVNVENTMCWQLESTERLSRYGYESNRRK